MPKTSQYRNLVKCARFKYTVVESNSSKDLFSSYSTKYEKDNIEVVLQFNDIASTFSKYTWDNSTLSNKALETT